MVNLSYRSHFDLHIILYFSSLQYISESIVTKGNKKATTQCSRFTNYIQCIHMINGYNKNQIARQSIYHKYIKPGNFIYLRVKNISMLLKKINVLIQCSNLKIMIFKFANILTPKCWVFVDWCPFQSSRGNFLLVFVKRT